MEIAPSALMRKRYVRYEPKSELVLTNRDLAILCDLHDRRFMNTRQFQKLYGANVDDRLKRLFLHGYIDRPKAQRVHRLREGGGSHPLIYALTNRGARAITIKLLRLDAAKRNWDELNRELSELSSRIPHELGIADAYVAFRLGCIDRAFDLVQGFELAPGKQGRALEVPGEEKLLYPDLIFDVVPQAAPDKESLFFLEWHTGSEPNTRYRSPELEHLTGKYEGYLAYARAKKSREQFGVSNFRVLTVTSGGEAKMQHIAKAAHEVCGGVGVGRFLVTNVAAFEAADPFDAAWLDASSKEVRLEV
jgi:hypothetical protein